MSRVESYLATVEELRQAAQERIAYLMDLRKRNQYLPLPHKKKVGRFKHILVCPLCGSENIRYDHIYTTLPRLAIYGYRFHHWECSDCDYERVQAWGFIGDSLEL